MTEKQLAKELEVEAQEMRELDAIVLVDDYGFEWTKRELDNAQEEYEIKGNLFYNKD